MAIDEKKQRVTEILAVHKGGISNLSAQEMDATNLAFDNASFDGVTML